LLDHTRSSYELEVLLNHDPTGPAFEHGERMHLNRLKLAIKLRQKKVRNANESKPHNFFKLPDTELEIDFVVFDNENRICEYNYLNLSSARIFSRFAIPV